MTSDDYRSRRQQQQSVPGDLDYWAQVSRRARGDEHRAIGSTKTSPVFRQQHELAQWLRANGNYGDTIYAYAHNRRTGKDTLLRAINDDDPAERILEKAEVEAFIVRMRQADWSRYPEFCPACVARGKSDGPCVSPEDVELMAGQRTSQVAAQERERRRRRTPRQPLPERERVFPIENVETPEEEF
jgi:hypothetical protein